jgi:hypothetical protein
MDSVSTARAAATRDILDSTVPSLADLISPVTLGATSTMDDEGGVSTELASANQNGLECGVINQMTKTC